MKISIKKSFIKTSFITTKKYFGFLLGLFVVASSATAAAVASDHALAMFGKPRYEKGFSHFNYVEPNAPKGGRLRFSVSGSFDSLNPLTSIGVPAFGVRDFVYESLMARSLDEPFTLYGLLAQRVEMAPDRSAITFHLHPKAKFSNGQPVRVEDIIFSVKTLREFGLPNHRLYYKQIKTMKKVGARAVRFSFTRTATKRAAINWELPLIVALMPVLSQRHWAQHTFGKARNVKPVGSGPYVVEKVEFGKEIIYARNKNHWGAGLAVNRGRFNFDRLVLSYWRDDNARFQALRGGLLDFFEEHTPTRWAKSYDFAAIKNSPIIKKTFGLKTPAPMWALALNTRRGLFADRKVRRALALTLDRAWINKNLFYGLWEENYSFWARSSMASTAQPAAPRASTARASTARARKRQALALLSAAGWQLQQGKLQRAGTPFAFTILVQSRLNERLALVWAKQLQRFGITARVRFVDSSQFARRKQNFDYDVIFARWWMSLSPGNEQNFYWSSEAARTTGSRNYAGVRSAAVDKTITALTRARTEKKLIQSVKQLDRLLLDGHFVIPLFYAKEQWVGLSAAIGTPAFGTPAFGTPAFGTPAKTSWNGYRIDTWWRKER